MSMSTIWGQRVIGGLMVLCLACGCSSETPRSGGRTASYWAEVLKQDDNVELRRKAALKLGPLILIDKAALPALLEAVKDTDAEVRASAARGLGIYSGPKGSEVLPALRELHQNDPDPKTRQMAGQAIERLESKGK